METTVQDANAGTSSIPDSMISSPDASLMIATAKEGDAAGKTGKENEGDGAPAKTDDSQKTATLTGNEDGEKDKGGKDKSEKEKNFEDQFDKHPRFQELNTALKTTRDALTAAEAKIALLEKSPVGSNVQTPGTPEFKDVTKMSAEDLREWQEDDPVGYANNMLAQATANAMAQLSQQSVRTATVSKISETFDNYAKENPTFNAMWESGEIETYMKAHPGHNAISAHIMLTKADGEKGLQEKINAAVAKAVKDTEDRVTKNFQAKRSAKVITEGSSTRSTADEVDPSLKDTKNFGGSTSVIANRLAESRRASH